MTITKANVCKYGRNQEGILLDASTIAANFIGKNLFTERHVKRVLKCLGAIQRGIVLRAEYMDSLKVAG